MVTRHYISTVYTAVVLPIISCVYLTIGQYLVHANDKYGIGQPYDVFSLHDALGMSGGGRNTVAFVNSGHTGGDIDSVIHSLSSIVSGAGKTAVTITSQDDLGNVCKGTIRSTSNCFGAVVFSSSPNEGSDGLWNYTLRADGALGLTFDVTEDSNDAQIYVMPFQRAVDEAIANITSPHDSKPLQGTTQALAYTQMTEDQRLAQQRQEYQSSFIDYLSVAFLVSLIGVCYHMPGHIATEREKGLSSLIDAMMPARNALDRQIARMAGHMASFAMVYFPGWLAASIILRSLIWKETNYGVVIVFFLLSGLAMTSMSLLGASFFKKAQLSGVVTAVVWLALGILAQALNNPGTAAVTILSVLFTPCNFVFFIVTIARFESEGQATNLLTTAPGSKAHLPGIVHWILMIVQALVYPVLAATVERWLHGVSTTSRRPGALSSSDDGLVVDTVRVEHATKIYKPSVLRRLFSFVSPPRPEVKAVDDVSLTAKRGQILALLGANGSGKSTTLDAIAGIGNLTSGKISVDTTGGLGVAPQQNVMWDELTVEEHIKIFNELKVPENPSTDEENEDLIDAIGLGPKTFSLSKTLSGGQKRKLQLGMMLTGGSAVCCVDEVSSGIDPLSRRKIWDILLSERSSRTIIMTTHFLDEADLLADNIVILSQGQVQAEGSSAELKDTMGAGYHIRVLDAKYVEDSPQIDGVERKMTSNTITYTAPSSNLAAEVIRSLEASDVRYQFSGPTIEDVFMHVESTMHSAVTAPPHQFGTEKSPNSEQVDSDNDNVKDLALLPGKPIGRFKQIWVLYRKRLTIFKTNWVPYVAALLIFVIAAGITQRLVKGKEAVGCTTAEQSQQTDSNAFTDFFDSALVVAGPASDFTSSTLKTLLGPLVPGSSSLGGGKDSANLKLVNKLSELESFINANYSEVMPGGWWLGGSGSQPLVAYAADNLSIYTSVITQNFLDVMLTNITIATSYSQFDIPVAPDTGDTLQLAVYLGLAACVVPGLFGLYVNKEKRTNVRGLEYSSGARSLALWSSHLLFDFAIILVAMALVTIIYASTSHVWYHVAYLFPVFMLYGLASMLISYLMSMVWSSALATYAATTAFTGIGFAVYLIAYLFIITFSDATAIQQNVLIGHWVISLIFPIGSFIRSLLVGLNAFSSACDGHSLQSDPAAMVAFGGPILYLAVQSILYFCILVYADSGLTAFRSGVAQKSPDSEDAELAEELVRVTAPEHEKDGLRIVHLAKAFGKYTAVDNVSFGVDHGEVFALLGPNGAGKSTVISLIRGDLPPSRNGGDVFVENTSIVKKRAQARSNLGVCPQFDAIDSLTVREHLQFYARLRGITDVDHQVAAVIRAVGLDVYANVMAHTLSGGNKRKLSLGIALTGNPSVILLDEPSSGLDAVAKRVMWRTLETVTAGRSILLTTHSMEEADALASRVGILAKHMLALGTPQQLRDRYGDTLHVHLVSKTAPHSTTAEMEHMRSWVQSTFPNAEIERETYHGQMRFSVTPSEVSEKVGGHGSSSSSAIGQLLIMLEEHKEDIGVAHHSISPTTLNQVFLSIVGQNDIVEEGYERPRPWYTMTLPELIYTSIVKKRQAQRMERRRQKKAAANSQESNHDAVMKDTMERPSDPSSVS